MYNFEEGRLVKELAKLHSREKVAFATAAAARQMSNYERYVRENDPSENIPFHKISEDLWFALRTGSTDSAVWASTLAEIMGLLPEERDRSSIWDALAENALTSLAYAVRCLLKPVAEEAAWAARHSYEAADQATIHAIRMSRTLPLTEGNISAHLFVQRELARQQRDLALLLGKPDNDPLSKVQEYASIEKLLTETEMDSFHVRL